MVKRERGRRRGRGTEGGWKKRQTDTPAKRNVVRTGRRYISAG